MSVIDLVVGGESDFDGELHDVGGRRFDERDVVVGEIVAREHGFLVSLCRYGFVFTCVLVGEGVLDAFIIELDVVAFEHLIHDEIDARSILIAIIDLVVGGEADFDGLRRDARFGRVVEREVVVVHIVADSDEFTRGCDGLVFADVLVFEGVGHLCVEDGDGVSVNEAIEHEVAFTLCVGVAVIDFVFRVEDDSDVALQDVQRGVVERVVVVLIVGENMAVFDDHARVETGSDVAAGGHVFVGDFIGQRDIERVAGGEGVFIEGVLSGEFGHLVAVGHFLRLCSDRDIALRDGQVAEVVDDVIVASDDIAVIVIDCSDGGDGVNVFANLDVI